ncbi:MAG: aminotransferase class I/II-fold pyridoxal phosphate-dependent enzyme [Anaerolineaceae bacterium]|nr:aminotransferase class I/II-fold pyridoxal phosphate-dependent enzyme [Anaerolineaceae bacterium]
MSDVISLGIGEPDFTTPQPILQAGIRSLQNGDTHYTSNAGILELRQALSTHLQRLYHVAYDPASELVITVGGSEALYLAATGILDAGDEVIILTPCFVAYQAEVLLAGGVPVEVPCRLENNFDVDPEDIRAAITPRTKAILIGFPSNPTGAVASRERLLEIARMAEEHDLIVISDEIYDQLVYGIDHVCFSALPGMRERSILLGGFSKDYAMTGWRIGFAAAPEHLMRGLMRIHQYSVMCSSTTSQMAAYEALVHGEPFVKQMVAEYDRRRRMFVDGLNTIGLRTFEPRGAFYAFPYVGETGLSEEIFADRLLEDEHVAVVPGSAFGKGGEGFVRCSYATAYDKLEEALDRIERFVKHL